MNKALYCLVIILTSAALSSAGEDFAAKFNEIKATNDDQKIQNFLATAEEAEKNNPEYYVLSANHWWSLSQKTVISTKPPEKGDFSLTDTKTGKTAGSISQVGTINPDIPQKAVNALVKGAKAFPERADIAVGLAHIQRELGRYDDSVSTLETLLKTAGAQLDGMRWMNGDKLPERASKYIPEIISGYSAFFYRRGTEVDDKRCERLAKATVSAFPDNPIAYNMLAALAAAHNKNDEALEHLLTAYKKDPNDPIIIMNLGETYSKLGKKQQARDYYNKVVNSTFEEKYKKAASEKLSRLKE
jgi:tetratricopeptide (TPR) repeat protein